MKNVRLGTWNISECVSARWDVRQGIGARSSAEEIAARCDEIVALVNRCDLDILCLQEFPVTINERPTVTRRIVNETALKYYHGVGTYPSFLISGGDVGVAIFSKTPLLSPRFSFMENPNVTKISRLGKIYWTFNKGLITADLVFDGRQLTVITGHAISFSPFDLAAEDYPGSFRQIVDCVVAAKPAENNVIAIGDFNTENLFGIQPELSRYVKDNLPGATTAPGLMEGTVFEQGRKLDYILTSPGVTVVRTEKIENFSDHFLCLCECAFA